MIKELRNVNLNKVGIFFNIFGTLCVILNLSKDFVSLCLKNFKLTLPHNNNKSQTTNRFDNTTTYRPNQN
jgi:hypothetical protein